MISKEVSAQLAPFGLSINGITRRLDSLYRNGNTNIAPGYLDVRKELDDRRWEKSDKDREEMAGKIDAVQSVLDQKQGAEDGTHKFIKKWVSVLGLVVLFLTLVVGAMGVYVAYREATSKPHDSLLPQHSGEYDAADRLNTSPWR